MKKLFVFFILLCTPAFAGVYEDALSKNDKVLLYFYIPECSSCKLFDSVYDEVMPHYKDIKPIKVNARTSYGAHLMQKFRGKYVPYIILTKSKTNKSVQISPYCAVDTTCMERALKNF